MSKQSTREARRIRREQDGCPDWCSGHREPLADEPLVDDRYHWRGEDDIVLTVQDHSPIVAVDMRQGVRETEPRIGLTVATVDVDLTLEEATMLAAQLTAMLIRQGGRQAKYAIKVGVAFLLLPEGGKGRRRLMRKAEQLLAEQRAVAS